MFTVLHQRDGVDTFYKAPTVEYIGPHANIGPSGLNLLCGPDEAVDGVQGRMLRGGTAFVMNDKGATVGRYDLGLPPTEGCGQTRPAGT